MKDEGPKMSEFDYEKFLDNSEKSFTSKLAPI